MREANDAADELAKFSVIKFHSFFVVGSVVSDCSLPFAILDTLVRIS